eukprot:4043126-Pyramimonas_sp.AAC.1
MHTRSSLLVLLPTHQSHQSCAAVHPSSTALSSPSPVPAQVSGVVAGWSTPQLPNVAHSRYMAFTTTNPHRNHRTPSSILYHT